MKLSGNSKWELEGGLDERNAPENKATLNSFTISFHVQFTLSNFKEQVAHYRPASKPDTW